ncbi:uncharacterized protein PAC_17600 [Phialocephala subalpina]|uniref:2EXR domain-containing protein n=1 Tax=Phialocephala subalpina TaxID=576137 RepID=A0A1L7XRK7_9HELO|nr:uncharacterized protein PAC_17600 [Phialocephala subalpina]
MASQRTFHLFPNLPKELRLQIWTCSLHPKPRIIDIELKNNQGVQSTKFGQSPNGPWRCSSKSTNIGIIPLFRVNHEARTAALEAFERTTIRTWNGNLYQGSYIDFSHDTPYITSYVLSRLLASQRTSIHNHREVLDSTSWTSKIQHLAISLNYMLSTRPSIFRGYSHYPKFGELLNPENRRYTAGKLLNIFQSFPALRTLSLVIDGRHEGIGGEDQLVDPSMEYEDFYEPECRELASAWIPDALEAVRVQKPDLHMSSMPKVGIKLLVNGESEELQQRWDYCWGKCRIVNKETEDDGRSWDFVLFPINEDGESSVDEGPAGIFTQEEIDRLPPSLFCQRPSSSSSSDD